MDRGGRSVDRKIPCIAVHCTPRRRRSGTFPGLSLSLCPTRRQGKTAKHGRKLEKNDANNATGYMESLNKPSLSLLTCQMVRERNTPILVNETHGPRGSTLIRPLRTQSFTKPNELNGASSTQGSETRRPNKSMFLNQF